LLGSFYVLCDSLSLNRGWHDDRGWNVSKCLNFVWKRAFACFSIVVVELGGQSAGVCCTGRLLMFDPDVVWKSRWLFKGHFFVPAIWGTF
jgi:hypothetical protein